MGCVIFYINKADIDCLYVNVNMLIQYRSIFHTLFFLLSIVKHNNNNSNNNNNNQLISLKISSGVGKVEFTQAYKQKILHC